MKLYSRPTALSVQLLFCFLTYASVSEAQNLNSFEYTSQTFAIERLKYIAQNDITRGKLKEAMQTLEKALTLSHERNLIDEEIDILILMGRVRFRESNSNAFKTNYFYKKALDLVRTNHNDALEATVLSELAKRHSLNGGSVDSSKLLMRSALEILRRHPDEASKAYVFINLSNIYGSVNLDSALYYGRAGVKWSQKSKTPNIQINALSYLASLFSLNNRLDSATFYHLKALTLAQQTRNLIYELNLLQEGIAPHRGVFIKDSIEAFQKRSLIINRKVGGILDSLVSMKNYAEAMNYIGNYPVALKTFLDLLMSSLRNKDSLNIATVCTSITDLYMNLEDYRMANHYSFLAKKFARRVSFNSIFSDVYAAVAYAHLKMPDSVKIYAKRGMATAEEFFSSVSTQVFGGVYNSLGRAYCEIGEYETAYQYLHKSYRYFKNFSNDKLNLSESYYGLAVYHLKNKMTDSAAYYARQTVILNTQQGFLNFTTEACLIMDNYFKAHGRYDSAYYYQQIGFKNYRQLNNAENEKAILRISLEEQQRALQLEAQQKLAQETYQSNLKLYGVSSLLIFSLAVGSLVTVGSRQRKKAYDLLKSGQAQIIQQRDKIEASLKEVKQFQSQLIQSEKMASLGELTAGIAHEIQNPLNFVNNFSEVNAELIRDLKSEIEKGNFEEIKSIARDIETNEEKINHHGKRAGDIVKSMLQHSRKSSGQKELTDINALCDEYLRLAYHGYRAKDKSFNAEFKIEFDSTFPKLNVIPQDIGRVVLNLINNAFYTVYEKSKMQSSTSGFQPLVTVITKNLDSKIEIRVRDNGNGIPFTIMEKIFQPFFTTKPTGQGTGLGLSLSYDIVTKGHGGELKVETKEGEGTEFIIVLQRTA